MLIVEIIGGLGNQMFQYAFYRTLKKHYSENKIKLFLGRFEKTPDNQGYELFKIFGINEPLAHKREVENLIDDSLNLPNRIKRKLVGPKRSYYCEKIFRYDPDVFKINANKSVYLRGLWQDELYFKEMRKELLEIFTFKEKLTGYNIEISKMIMETNAVSLHIRRGDYILNEKYKMILGNICTYNYYKKAISLLKEEKSDLTFFVFSDDIPWVQSNYDFLHDEDATFVHHNSGFQSYIDMQLMSNCKHNIIANSSFSWWGAWLNPNPQKTIIAPLKWFKNDARLQSNHIVPDDWIQIEG